MQTLNKQTSTLAQQIGARGENIAGRFLVAQGYTILAQNWRSGQFELDFVVLDVKTREIVFVEVKTRSTSAFGHPGQAVDHRKLNALFQAAKLYLTQSGLDNEFRFDIISVLPGRVEHSQNVSWIR